MPHHRTYVRVRLHRARAHIEQCDYVYVDLSGESGAPTAHKQLLGTERSRWTRLTRAFSGRFARGMVNEWMNQLERAPEKILPYPAQYDATRPTRQAAAAQGDAEHIALWAGQTAPLARAMHASDLVALLARETDTVLSAKHLRPRTATATSQ